jgi:hypothetical protein
MPLVKPNFGATISGATTCSQTLSSYNFDQLQGGFPDGAHQRQGRQPDQGRDAFRGQFQKAGGAGLVRRFINDPEEDYSHLKEPENAGQVRFEIARNAHAAIDQDAAEPGDIDVADSGGFGAEG